MSLDFASCTMLDVIRRSALMHPSLLADALDRAAQIRLDYSCCPEVDSRTKDIAFTAYQDCDMMCRELREVQELPARLTHSQETMAFSAAAKLLCIPRATQHDIAARGYSA